MGLLQSVDNVPGIDFYEYRDESYYSKYEYRVRFRLPGARYVWFCKKPEDLDARLSGTGYASIHTKDKQEVKDNAEAIKAFVSIRNNLRKNKTATVRIEYNTIAVFSNDLQLLKSIEIIDPSFSYDYTQVQRAQYAGIKHFVKEPKYNYRVYLKSKRVSGTFAEDLFALINRTKTIYPSPALKSWLKDAVKHKSGTGWNTGWNTWRYSYSSSSYFMDYDDESTLSYLALMHDGMLGKRYKLEKRPVTV